jgi:RNA polymerase sigma factor (TIGR02999 family)
MPMDPPQPPPRPVREEITALLDPAGPGGSEVMDRILPLVYGELRRIARSQRARGPSTPTLRTTALVHEAYLRCVDDTRVTRQGRAYFYAALARAMRQVLIEAARRRETGKRGGGAHPLTLDEETQAVDAYADELLDLERALEELESRNPRLVRVVECRHFSGRAVEETADALQVSPRTVKTDWAMARAWLRRRLDASSPSPDRHGT